MRRLIITILIVLSLLLAACSTATPTTTVATTTDNTKQYYEKGIAAYNSGDYLLAKSFFEKVSTFSDASVYLESINKRINLVLQSESKATSASTTPTTTIDKNTVLISIGPGSMSTKYMSANLQKNMSDPNTGKPLPYTTQFIDIGKIQSASGLSIAPFVLKKDGEIITAIFTISNPGKEIVSTILNIELVDKKGATLDKIITDKFDVSAGKSRDVKYTAIITGMAVDIGKATFTLN